jgi:hypothetical protein
MEIVARKEKKSSKNGGIKKEKQNYMKIKMYIYYYREAMKNLVLVRIKKK